MSPIKVDPVEFTEEYQKAMLEIQPELDKVDASTPAPAFWALKKRLLQERGIEWKSPVEMNPEIIFD